MRGDNIRKEREGHDIEEGRWMEGEKRKDKLWFAHSFMI